jgi:protein-tyrosine phosphatase
MVIDQAAPEAVAPFRVLVVSDRSTCRGPAVQRLLAAHLRAGGWDGDVVLGVAGVRAGTGEPVHPDTARALAEVDVDAGGHLARRLTERRVVQADLVLAVGRRSARRVTELRPDAARRTFALHEFARLAAEGAPAQGGPGDGGATVAERVAALDARRRRAFDPLDVTSGAAQDPDADVADPSGGGYADHRRMVRALDGITLQVAQVLTSWVPARRAGGGSRPAPLTATG